MAEIDDLRQEVNQKFAEMDQSIKVLQGLIDGQTRFTQLRADQGQFMVPPVEVAYIGRDSVQSISSGAWTAVEFNFVSVNTGIILWDSADPTYIKFPQYSQKAVYLFLFQVSFTAYISSYVKAMIYPGGMFYDINTSLSWARMSGLYPMEIAAGASPAQLLVVQNSGGAQDMLAQLVVWRIR